MTNNKAKGQKTSLQSTYETRRSVIKIKFYYHHFFLINEWTRTKKNKKQKQKANNQLIELDTRAVSHIILC